MPTARRALFFTTLLTVFAGPLLAERQPAPPQTVVVPWAFSVGAHSDVNGDGRSDLVWRNASTGGVEAWTMNGTALAPSGVWTLPTETDRGWRIRAVEDFTGDGVSDLLWYQVDSGESRISVIEQGAVTRSSPLPGVGDTDWQIVAVGDFDGDAQNDIVWRHRVTGRDVIWFIKNAGIEKTVEIPGVGDPAWEIVGSGDFDGDGHCDLLWWHARTSTTAVWLMNGGAMKSVAVLSASPERSSWQVVGVGDVDGDSKDDVVWRQPTTGLNYVWKMNGAAIATTGSGYLTPAGADFQALALLDTNGDKRADLVWRNVATGDVSVWLLNGLTTTASGTTKPATDLGWTIAGPSVGPEPKLFLATLVPESGVTSAASGYATLLLAADEKSARLTLEFNTLNTTEIAAHVHGPASGGQSAGIVFSLPLGTFKENLWVFEPSQRLTIQQQIDAIKAGQFYVNVHSMTSPDGEIRGYFRPAPGSAPRSIPPPPPPAGPPSVEGASRFIDQATFGTTPALVDHVRAVGYDAFLNEQFQATPSLFWPFVWAASTTNDGDRTGALRTRFFQNALKANDQLRQRVAFALSQILVVSGRDIPDGPALANYHDILVRNAFGNYRQILEEVTLSPMMGNYLDMVNNDKPNLTTGRTANENYAREVMQLFSVGLFTLNQNGSLRLDPVTGLPVPTYAQESVEGLARVFTGWTYPPKPGATSGSRNPTYYYGNMALWPNNHDTALKRILNGRVLPAGQTGTQDLKDALDTIFYHPNIAPFMARRLIQHLVTSNPTPGYVARVAFAFNGGGGGVRGDMKAVVRAILLDPEARGEYKTDPSYGHLQEPAVFAARFLRNLGAAGDGYGIHDQVSRMEQNVFFPPTVFSFYSPDHLTPGSVLFGPEFEIYTESTTVRKANFVNSLLNGPLGLPSYAPAGSVPVSIDINAWSSLASNPTLLVETANNRLMHWALPPDMKAVIIQAVSAIPASRPTTRTRTALYLIAASPQYGVIR